MLKALGILQIFFGSHAINDIVIVYALNKSCCNLSCISLYSCMFLITNLIALAGGVILACRIWKRIELNPLTLLVGYILLGITAITVSTMGLWMIFQVVMDNSAGQMTILSWQKSTAFETTSASQSITPSTSVTALEPHVTPIPDLVTPKPNVTTPEANVTTSPRNVTSPSNGTTPLNVTTPTSNVTVSPSPVRTASTNVTIFPSNVTMVTQNRTTTPNSTVEPTCIMNDCSSAVVTYALSCIVVTFTFTAGILSFLAAYELGVIWSRRRRKCEKGIWITEYDSNSETT